MDSPTPTLLSRDARVAVLRACGADEPALDALLEYGASPYTGPGDPGATADEPHVEVWRTYAADAGDVGAFAALRERFVQLRFPIADGISKDEAYRAATLRGEFARADAFQPGLVLRRPEAMTLSIVPSAAGRVPVLVVEDRADFESLVRALTERNEPAEVPASMGACLVSGLINWHRIALHREAWEQTAQDASDAAWGAEFKSLIPRKALYQDRLVLLSSGTYSAVPAEESGGPVSEWLARSVAIRREHELFHYFTYRRFGRIRTHVVDEVLADFVGLAHADGAYRAAVGLRFLGLDRFPEVRPDGRVHNYVTAALPEGSLPVIAGLVVRCARNLETIATQHRAALQTAEGLTRVLNALCPLALDELASDVAPAHVSSLLAGDAHRA